MVIHSSKRVNIFWKCFNVYYININIRRKLKESKVSCYWVEYIEKKIEVTIGNGSNLLLKITLKVENRTIYTVPKDNDRQKKYIIVKSIYSLFKLFWSKFNI